MLTRRVLNATMAALLGGAALTVGCGGGGSPMNGPSSSAAATITLSSSGASPRSVTVPRGSQVQFVNDDRASHQMDSNPHPEHTDCPEINAVGFLSAGQSRQTGNLNTARTCGFHDHDNPNNTSLQGTIVVQ
jgi:hypothetical protein